ncbi:MAG: hypothetical protein QW470_07520 [Candidatus Caldarchaeum sp.]
MAKSRFEKTSTTVSYLMLDAVKLRDQIMKALEKRYFSNHPFMKLFYAGKLTPEQVKGWIINRYYYQKQIPLKDSIILANCNDYDARRLWLQRLMKREGVGGYKGDVEGWATLAEAAGISRNMLENAKILPGVRLAVDAYLNFVKTVSWVEGVASSLSELLAVNELPRRIEALRQHYRWIEPHGLEFFLERLSYIKEDIELVLSLLAKHITTRAMLKKCVEAACFNCDVHWLMLDAIYMEYIIPRKIQNL